jgi:hypothetical protein
MQLNVRKLKMLRSWSLQRRYAFTTTAYSLRARRCRVCRGSIRYVSFGEVGAARRWRWLGVSFLLLEACDGGCATNRVRRTCALAIRISLLRDFRVKRALAKQRCWALVALLLEPLRTHRSEEAMRGKWNMSSARCCCRTARGSHASSLTDATLRARSSSRRTVLRPPVLRIAGVGSRDGRGS